MIQNYNDFITKLLEAGFSMGGGGGNDGIYSVVDHGWYEESDSPVQWHTGNADTDPWEWRMRVLDERDDIAYGKVFFKKSGFITREWAPYFLAARRGSRTFEQEYDAGRMNNYAKRIYSAVTEFGALPLEDIKREGNFYRDEKSKFDAALTELQMKMYLTMCGGMQKVSKFGSEYGWSSTVFCTTEDFWGDELFAKAAGISKDEAIDKITARVLQLNPAASEKKIAKFITG